jgi:hypothetical protein
METRIEQRTTLRRKNVKSRIEENAENKANKENLKTNLSHVDTTCSALSAPSMSLWDVIGNL